MKRWIAVAALVLVGAAFALLWPRPAPVVGVVDGHAGSEACKGCHPEAYEAWLGSGHGRHMGRPSPENVVGDFERDNVYDYNGTRSRMYREGDRYLMEYTRDGRTTAYEIAWALGVTRHQVYLWQAPDGRLQVLPTYWNLEENHWRDSTEGPVEGPGPTKTTDRSHWENHGRTYQLACMECHASQAQRNYDGSTNTYATTFDPRINCESCHGPAAQHVARWRALQADAPDGLRPLPDLDLHASIEVCARCHARKKVYQTGDEADFYDAFAPETWGDGEYFADGRSRSLNYRYVEYMQSRCFEGGTERLDCGYCHPPHGLESARHATVAEANALCTECHVGHKTRLTAHTHHAAESEGSRCVECHMPKMDLNLRMTVRDHTIGSPLPELTRDFGAPNACDRCHATEGVDWAVHWVEQWYGERPSFRALQTRMRARAEVLSAAFDGRPDVPRLVGWLDDPSRSLVERSSAAEILGDARPSPVARAALARHVGDPHPLVRHNALRALSLFDGPEARAALRTALGDEARIVRVAAFQALSFLEPALMKEKGAVVEQARAETQHRREVVRVDDPRWMSNRALWHHMRGERAEAEALLRRAVTLSPRMPGRRADLVQLMVESGRLKEAERLLNELRAVAPEAPMTGIAEATVLLARGRARQAVQVLEALDQELPLVQRALRVARQAAR